MNESELIYELIQRVEELKEIVRDNGGCRDPRWININFKLAETIRKANPYISTKVINLIDGPLEELTK